eukprot:CAMPEP_0170175798 /NCGR_PEP_ID=MMETSP0040_2-20121228/8812_1 /TAXON_ID=641309 /ORGANISM="Lotharella oceanica, Strain CCMP622" /LENGTH=124 /DNA_ID=CAMNT_0010417911 /DNA_START=693 /DNA_END=1063 /DNA_ORIENTATION=-
MTIASPLRLLTQRLACCDDAFGGSRIGTTPDGICECNMSLTTVTFHATSRFKCSHTYSAAVHVRHCPSKFCMQSSNGRLAGRARLTARTALDHILHTLDTVLCLNSAAATSASTHAAVLTRAHA